MKHVKSHTVEKPFQYGNCDKAFPDEDMPMEHLMMNTGEKPL